jgi:ABC-type phosphate/phosphonate transport system ATPase subunit
VEAEAGVPLLLAWTVPCCRQRGSRRAIVGEASKGKGRLFRCMAKAVGVEAGSA